MKKPNPPAVKHVANRKKATREEIALVAHSLFEKAGRPEGKDLEHWFNAESMIESNFGYGDSHTESDFTQLRR